MEEVTDKKTDTSLAVYEVSLVAIIFLKLAIILPMVGLSQLFIGIIFLSCLVVIGILFGRTYSEGNISDFHGQNYKFVWRDKALSEDITHAHMVRNLVMASVIETISIIIMLLSLYFLGGLPMFSSVPLYNSKNVMSFVDLFTISFLSLVLTFEFILIIAINMLMKRRGIFAPRELILYDKGLRVLNRMIPWNDIHTIARPKHYKYSENLSKIIVFIAMLFSNNGMSHLKYPLYKIVERNGKVHIVPIADIEGLKIHIEKYSQVKLIE